MHCKEPELELQRWLTVNKAPRSHSTAWGLIQVQPKLGERP